MGYGIIKHIDDYYDFSIDVIKEYILQKEELTAKLKTVTDKWEHLCTARGELEVSMRKMVKNVLLSGFSFNEKETIDYVMSKIYNDTNTRRKYATYNINDLFNPAKAKIYLKSLSTLINGKWEWFSVFMKNDSQNEISHEEFIHMMDVLNKDGRFDAHAKVPEDESISIIDAIVKQLKGCINQYNSMMN